LHLVLSSTKKKYKRMLLFSWILLKQGRHFDYWNQPLNIRMCGCYLDCHEAGLCSYLLILIENILRQLQLFYFNLWPIYWLSLEVPNFATCILRVHSNIPRPRTL
jgi:hypothetical protein